MLTPLLIAAAAKKNVLLGQISSLLPSVLHREVSKPWWDSLLAAQLPCPGQDAEGTDAGCIGDVLEDAQPLSGGWSLAWILESFPSWLAHRLQAPRTGDPWLRAFSPPRCSL